MVDLLIDWDAIAYASRIERDGYGACYVGHLWGPPRTIITSDSAEEWLLLMADYFERHQALRDNDEEE